MFLAMTESPAKIISRILSIRKKLFREHSAWVKAGWQIFDIFLR
jgi:hypothetical protein